MHRGFWKVVLLMGLGIVGSSFSAEGQEKNRFIHGLSIEGRPEYVFPTHPFLKGDNAEGKRIRTASSAHFRYAFRYRPDSDYDYIYRGVYQGIGVGMYNFGEPEQIGNPWAFYLFQGARIARFCPWLFLNYEWNFGLSTGWKPYDAQYNSYNKIVGSKINAYINTDLYLRWLLSSRWSLVSGFTLTHFSNGNTSFPNAGINTMGVKLGLEYNFFQQKVEENVQRKMVNPQISMFRRHVSYDFVFFGSWRRKGIWVDDGRLPSPESYPVFGFHFTPMYNLDYKLRLGLSLDGIYDGSANLYLREEVYDDIDKTQIQRPPLYSQFALGTSARLEYVMPFFTVGLGAGVNFIGKGDLKALYQMLILKIALSREVFMHIGYNLQDFHEPNYLMLGIGFRFNSKYDAF